MPRSRSPSFRSPRPVYSAIIVEGTKNLASAQLLLQFLSGDAFRTQLAAYGFDPIAGR